MKKILVIGSLNMDLVTTVKKIPAAGETILGDGLKKIAGGKGANQAVAIGKLGGNVKMMGMLGKDTFSNTLLENLKKNDVNTDYIFSSKVSPTGTALIAVNEDGNNSIVVIPGANFDFTDDLIDQEPFKDVDYVLSQFEIPLKTIEKAFKIAKKNNIKTILNPAPAVKVPDEILKYTDILIPNETEFQIITGNVSLDKENILLASKTLFKKGIKNLILTLGERGVIHIDEEGTVYEKPAYNVHAIDTTAAGDSFIGGLLTKMSEGKDINDAIDYAVMVSALTVSRKGAQTSLPTKEEVEQFKENVNEKRKYS